MMDDELDHIAGEYVLGTLSLDERKDVEARLEHDRDLVQAVKRWEQRLAPLNDDEALTQTQIHPPDSVWQSIAPHLGEQADVKKFLQGVGDNVFAVIALERLKQSRNRWRSAAIGAMALAASLIGLQALGISLPFMQPPSSIVEQRLVGVLNPSGSSPGFLIRVDIANKRLEVERLTKEASSGKDYELWLIEPDSAPKSLNVVGRNKVQEISYQSAVDAKGLTFAITLEPEGGSPTGKATGPIVYSGTLFNAE